MQPAARAVTPLIAVALCATAGTALAAGARTGVQPQPGEMVLLRDVAARPAVRPAPPGVALIVDPTPNRQLMPTLAHGELGDADFMALDTGPRVDGGAAPAGLAAPMLRTLAGAPAGGSTARDAAGASATGTLGAATGGTFGIVGQATRGIGDHVTGALSQLPLGQGDRAGGP